MLSSLFLKKAYGLLFACFLSVGFCGAVVAQTESYPQRSVRIIVPVSAGGSTDKIARLIAEKLSSAWGQTVIVENITGAGGAIGAAQVAQRCDRAQYHSAQKSALHRRRPERRDALGRQSAGACV